MKFHFALICAAMVIYNVPAAELRLPDPLTTTNDTKVTSAEMWRQTRRPEILELFRTHVYGRMPAGRPDSLKFETLELARGVMDGTAIRKRVKISYRGPGGEGAIHLVLFVPERAKPVTGVWTSGEGEARLARGALGQAAAAKTIV